MPILLIDKHTVTQEETFCIMTGMHRKQIMQNIGVLGKIVKRKNSPSMFNVYFNGLVRVYFHITKTDAKELKAEWIFFDETFDMSHLSGSMVTKEIQLFKRLVARYFAVLEKKQDQGVKIFLSSLVAKKAMSVVRQVNKDTLSQAIDVLMNIINATYDPRKEILDVMSVSTVVLMDRSVIRRLFYAEQLLSWLTKQRSAYPPLKIPIEGISQKGQKETVAEENAGHQNKLSDAEKSNPIQQLLVPHIITPRFPQREQHEEPSGELITLDYERPSPFMKNVLEYYDQYIVNQERAKRKIAETLVFLRHRRVDSAKPVIGGLFPGPTGVGKSDLIRVGANYLFGNPKGYTHIPCNILQEQHSTARLIGAPPGYVGYDDEPFFSQWRLERHHVLKRLRDETGEHFHEIYAEVRDIELMLRTEKPEHRPAILQELQGLTGWVPGTSLSFVLFDEFERAHPNHYEILMQIFDDGTFPLMNGEVTDFKNTVFFFTSNLYGEKLMKEISGRGKMGFYPDFNEEALQENFRQRIWNEVLKEVEKHFSSNPAFFARIGKENIEVCYPLKEEDYFSILNIYIDALRHYLWQEYKIKEMVVSEAVKNYFVCEARDPLNRALGVRAFERVFEKLEKSITNLLDQEDEQNKLIAGDWVYIGVSSNRSNEKRKLIVQKRH